MKTGFRNTLAMLLVSAFAYSLISVPAGFAQDDKKEEKKEGKKLESITLKDGMAKVESSLKADDEKDKVQKKPAKVFAVDLKSGQNYQIDMVSKEIDSYLRLEDSTGKELAKDDDGGGDFNARITFKCPKDDTYRIIGTTFNGSTGGFTLTIKQPVLVKAGELVLKDGAVQVDSQLTNEDGKDTVRAQSVCKIFAVKFAKGKTFQVDLMSKQFDSYLRLEDSKGKELAHDDDGGDGFNARIQFTCPEDDVYRIVATTFAGGTGIFTLAVKEK